MCPRGFEQQARCEFGIQRDRSVRVPLCVLQEVLECPSAGDRTRHPSRAEPGDYLVVVGIGNPFVLRHIPKNLARCRRKGVRRDWIRPFAVSLTAWRSWRSAAASLVIVMVPCLSPTLGSRVFSHSLPQPMACWYRHFLAARRIRDGQFTDSAAGSAVFSRAWWPAADWRSVPRAVRPGLGAAGTDSSPSSPSEQRPAKGPITPLRSANRPVVSAINCRGRYPPQLGQQFVLERTVPPAPVHLGGGLPNIALGGRASPRRPRSRAAAPGASPCPWPRGPRRRRRPGAGS